MTITRQTTAALRLLLACWFASFLPLLAVGQESPIKPTVIIECDNPDVTASVSTDNRLQGYLPASGMEISATWTQGSESGTIDGFQYTSRTNGTCYFLSQLFTPKGTGIITIKITVSSTNVTYTLSLSRCFAQVSIIQDGAETSNTTFKEGETLSIQAQEWTKGDTTFSINQISAYSKDGKWYSSSNDSSLTFSMPASDIYISVEQMIKIKDSLGRQLSITSYTAAEAKKLIDEGIKALQELEGPNTYPGDTLCLFNIELNVVSKTIPPTLTTPMRIALPYPDEVTCRDGIRIVYFGSGKPSSIIYPTLGQDSLSFPTSNFGYFLLCVDRAKSNVIPDSITISPKTLSLTEGANATFNCTVFPSNLTSNNDIILRSTNEAIATVSANGTVTGVKPGTCDIIARTWYGGHEDTCTVTVSKKPDPVPDPDEPTSVDTPSADAPHALGTAGELILTSTIAIRADVYTLTGHCLLRERTVDGTLRIRLAAGLYIVRFADGTTHKVIIR